MRTLARAATGSLVALCVALSVVVAGVAAIGVVATRSAASQGNTIAGDELTTAIVTNQLARNIDAAYTAGQEVLEATQPAQQARLLRSLYTSLLPAVDAELFSLEQLHVGDPPAELADLQLFIRQWTAVRNLLSLYDLNAQPASALAAQLTAAYQPVSAHLDQLILKERSDANADHAQASASAQDATGLLVGVAVVGLVLGLLLLRYGFRRIRRNLEPSQAQAEFADILQIANDEDEAHQLLQRHLERTLNATTAVVLNRNNSADRLEAVTPLPDGSPLPRTLRGAEPRSCLAVRSGRAHREDGGRPVLLSCPVCGPVPGASSCVPLTVGGEVIGSVLLCRPARYSEAEEQRIRESVGQAAPVLANLRNLAVAEIRAATDGLTGLPNKRAVTDALEADVRPGHHHQGAARAAPGRPGPLQAGQRPARARGGRSGPGERRRGAPRRAAEQGLRGPQRRGGVRGHAARHRRGRGARDRRADPRGDRGDLPPGQRRIGHGLHRRGRLPGPREHPGPARAPRRRGPVRGQAAGPEPRRAGRAGLRRWPGRPPGRYPGRSSRTVGQRFRAGAGAQGRPGVTTPGSARPTGRGTSAARAWSAGSRPRPSRPCRAAARWSARPS